MKRYPRWRLVGSLVLALFLTPLSARISAQEKKVVPPGTGLNITVTSAAATPPPVSITLYERHGHVTPQKSKCAHTGGGLIDISSPSADTVVLTMTGVVVADAEMRFDVEQCFEINFDDPKVKKAKLTIEGRVIGLLRGHTKGCADYTDACAHVNSGPVHLVSVCVPPHSVCGCDNLSVNDHDGPFSAPVQPGKYTLVQTFSISAHSKCCLCKKPSAEFAPDPALDTLWISYWEPFHGVIKKDFGFQVTLKVAPEEEKKDGNGNGNDKKEGEKLPPPKP
jgi:hypothetical protein